MGSFFVLSVIFDLSIDAALPDNRTMRAPPQWNVIRDGDNVRQPSDRPNVCSVQRRTVHLPNRASMLVTVSRYQCLGRLSITRLALPMAERSMLAGANTFTALETPR